MINPPVINPPVINPIVVKEFRQAVRSRLVIVILTLFLLGNLAVVGGYLLTAPEAATSTTAGQGVFGFLAGVLFFTCIVFVPLYTGIRLSLERNEGNMELLYVTTIRPGAIVRGKYFTAMALTLLIYSACMPFIAFTYFLRGVDLASVGFVLLICFVICSLANGLGVFAGAIGGNWIFRGLAGLALLACLAGLMYLTAMGPLAAMRYGLLGRGMYAFEPGVVALLLHGWEQWVAFATVLLIVGLGIGLLCVFAAAMIGPRPTNRMLLPRLYATGTWLVSGGVAAVWSFYEKSDQPMIAWMTVASLLFTVMLIPAIGERDTWGVRVRRTIPRNRLARWLAFLFYSGSAGGVLWCSLMVAATLLATKFCLFASSFAPPLAWGESMYHPPFESGVQQYVLAKPLIGFGYVLCYCLTAVAFRSTLLRKVPTVMLPLVVAGFGLLMCSAPYLIAFFAGIQWWGISPWWLIGSPLVVFTSDSLLTSYCAVPLLFAWSIACIFATLPWLNAQWVRFVPLGEKA